MKLHKYTIAFVLLFMVHTAYDGYDTEFGSEKMPKQNRQSAN